MKEMMLVFRCCLDWIKMTQLQQHFCKWCNTMCLYKNVIASVIFFRDVWHLQKLHKKVSSVIDTYARTTFYHITNATELQRLFMLTFTKIIVNAILGPHIVVINGICFVCFFCQGRNTMYCNHDEKVSATAIFAWHFFEYANVWRNRWHVTRSVIEMITWLNNRL